MAQIIVLIFLQADAMYSTWAQRAVVQSLAACLTLSTLLADGFDWLQLKMPG
jgi:hypothetical protein